VQPENGRVALRLVEISGAEEKCFNWRAVSTFEASFFNAGKFDAFQYRIVDPRKR
jgi:hypothetical protein